MWDIRRRTQRYAVATISRLLKITGLFCKRTLQKRLYSAKETYDFRDPTRQSHPIRHTCLTDIHVIGLFCKRALQKRLYFAKETYDFKEPTSQSHPIRLLCLTNMHVIGLFCKRALQKRPYSAKETYDFNKTNVPYRYACSI